MNVSAIRIIEFDAAHRVHNHESKCATLHGHRYKIEVHAEASQLDTLGRVIDFSVLKERVGGWIDEYWDHTTILYCEDHEVIEALKNLPRKKEPFILDKNPTAENMGLYLLQEICPSMLQGTGITVRKLVVWETPNCKVNVTLD